MERVCQMCQTLIYDDEQTSCYNCGAELAALDVPEEAAGEAEPDMEETTGLDLDGLLDDHEAGDEDAAPDFDEIDAELGLEDDDTDILEDEPDVTGESLGQVETGADADTPDEDGAEEPAGDDWDTGAIGAGAGMDDMDEIVGGEGDDVGEPDAVEESPETPDEAPVEDNIEDDIGEDVEDDIEVELADDEMLCPSCNNVMKAESAVCPNCSQDTEHLRACPACGVGIDKIAEICPHCYTDLSMLADEPDEDVGAPDAAEVAESDVAPAGTDTGGPLYSVPDAGDDDGEPARDEGDPTGDKEDSPDEEKKARAKADREFKKALKAVMKIEKGLQKDLDKGKIDSEEFETMLNKARVEHGLEPIDLDSEGHLVNGNGKHLNGNGKNGYKNGKARAKERRRIEQSELERIIEEEKQEEGILSYYTLSLITLFFFVFTAVFVLMEFILTVTQITNDTSIPVVTFSLVPTFGFVGGMSVLMFAVIVTLADAILHLWDKKINLWLSLIPSFIMAAGLSLDMMYSSQFIGGDLIWITIMLILLILMIVIDFFCLLFKYPAVLENSDRSEFEVFLDKENEIHDIQQKLEEEYQQMIEEEEEKLKMKDEEIHEIKTELESLSDQIQQEEEKLRMKEEEISAIKAELELKTQEIMEEEEKLRMKEDEMESIIQTELQKRKEDMMMEEEEKLRMKEDELIRARNELEIQKNLMDDTREKLRLKEQEMMSLRTELENQMKHRMEEEDRLKLKEAAAKMLDRGKQKRVLFPFTAMVGQDKMKRALILNAIYPEIGGVLIRGQKGTGKSVSVRGLSEILPNIEVPGCKFNCDPKDVDNLCTECKARFSAGNLETNERQVQVVDLPLNVTEDRLVGSIDIEKVLTEGVKSFEPGILAEAHRGVLYVDEINLLDDYIVDILLDAASSGVVTIEREGISLSHPSKFIIVGSMNPEEGELRPQILDRIALQTDVVGIKDVDKRIDIVKRREEFTADPEGFRERFEPSRVELVERITRAKELLPKVTTPPRIFKLIAQICLDFNVDGHRADIIIERAARANAAFEGRTETNIDDVTAAAAMALPHRMHRRGFEEEEEFSEEMLRKLIEKREAEME